MNDRPKNIVAIVDRVLSADPAQRSIIVAEACAGDAALRHEVESLLRACDAAGSFLESSPIAVVRESAAGSSDDVPMPMPERLAGFRIQRVLGVGGMGIVYLAAQDKPRRTVALKVIKPGLATPSILRRFEHEAEVLGRLHHPGIAQVYGAGTAEGALGPQPFFAMELVDGKPITAFVAERGLKTHERLDLMARVCDAVQHAHQQGIIHRDLKPSNILVDSSGQPKILDFGVARVSRTDGVPETVNTQAGQIVGTLAYMSPEQAAGDSLAVDTRADVYSLGVIAYELLSGKLPVEIGDQPLHERVRAVHEQAPRPLSSVDTAFRGDIDTVVAKSLQKDKDHRYQSAAEFAADLRRILAHEPVLARPASAWYQATKFARRHRLLVGTVGASVGILGLAAAVLLVLVLELRRVNRDLIVQRNAAIAAEGTSRTQLARSTAVLTFVGDMFESLQPYRQGRDSKTIDALNGTAPEIERRYKDQPLLAAELHLLVGRGYRGIGELSRARTHLDAAKSLAISSTERDERLLESIASTLAFVDSDAGHHEAALAVHAKSAEDATERYGRASAAALAANLALVETLKKAGKREQAVAIATKVLAAAGSDVPLNDRSVVGLRLIVAADPILDGNLFESVALLKQLLDDTAGQFGLTDAATLNVAGRWFAMLVQTSGGHSQLQYMRELVAAARASRGDADAETQGVMVALASGLFASNSFDEGLSLLHAVLSSNESRFGEAHPLALMMRSEFAKRLVQGGGAAQAVAVLRRGVDVASVSLGKDHSLTQSLTASFNAALDALDSGDTEIAMAKLQLVDLQRRPGPAADLTITKMYLVIDLLQRRRRFLEANDLADDLVQRSIEALGRTHPKTACAMVVQGWSLAMLNWLDRAEPVLLRAYDSLRQVEGEMALVYKRLAVDGLAGICEIRGEHNRAQHYRDALAKMPMPDLSNQTRSPKPSP